MTNTAVLLPLLQTGVRPGLSKGVLTREQVAAMSDEAFRSLCRRYQAAFKELVPIVDAEGCRDAEGRVVSSTLLWCLVASAQALLALLLTHLDHDACCIVAHAEARRVCSHSHVSLLVGSQDVRDAGGPYVEALTLVLHASFAIGDLMSCRSSWSRRQ